MRTLVDANVVLRYMLHDDAAQVPIAEQTIRQRKKPFGVLLRVQLLLHGIAVRL